MSTISKNLAGERKLKATYALKFIKLQVAESQPTVSDDMLRLVMQAIVVIENRIPALERSIQEIKIDWRLS